MAILIDTNVLLRTAQPAHPHRPIALEALERCRASGQRLVLVPQNIYEFWVVLTRPTDRRISSTPRAFKFEWGQRHEPGLVTQSVTATSP